MGLKSFNLTVTKPKSILLFINASISNSWSINSLTPFNSMPLLAIIFIILNQGFIANLRFRIDRENPNPS